MKIKLSQLLLAILAMVGIHCTADTLHTMKADDYGRMWTEVSKAFNEDLPKTALDRVVAIRNRAAAEGNYPQLMRALCTEYTLADVISPDSDEVVVRSIEAAAARETRSVEQALWQSALGQLKHDADHLRASVTDLEALAAARVQDYVPAFAIGDDSYVFDDDLLHVIGAVVMDHYSYGEKAFTHEEKCAFYERMRGIYESQHNELAVLVLDFRYGAYSKSDEVKTGRMIERIRQLTPKYKKTNRRAHGNVVQHMQQWVESQEAPYVSVKWDMGSDFFYPGLERSLAITSRNVEQMELRFYRIKGLTNRDDALKGSAKDYKAKAGSKKLALSLSHKLTCLPAHEQFSDTLRFNLPGEGIYIVQLLADGKECNTQWLSISRLTALTTTTKSARDARSRLVVVDAKTGQPLTDDVHLYAQRMHTSLRDPHYPGNPYVFTGTISPKELPLFDNELVWEEITPDDDGTFDVTGMDRLQRVAISQGDDHFFPTFYGGKAQNHFSLSSKTGSYGRLFTDRAIYRPGQDVHFSGLVYSRHDDDYNVVEGWTGQVTLQDTEGKSIAEIDVKADDFGQFDGTFTLPSPAIPGCYTLLLDGHGVKTSQAITVEEYKRPTFHVELDAVSPRELLGKERYEVGDTLVLNGCVKTFSGVPVADAKVTWQLDYTTWGRPSGTWLMTHQTTTGDIQPDAEGRFTMRFPLTSEGYYRISCDALASSGETASASYSLRVGQPTPIRDEAEKLPELFSVTTNKAGDEATMIIDLRALDRSDSKSFERPVFLFYDMISTLGQQVESHRCVLTDDQQTFTLKWREEYGDGAVAYVAFIKDGQLYSQQMAVRRPYPEKELKLEWSTFRDRLQPGQEETWTLRVRRPDGTPADARVMARLYDASLDAFVTAPWMFGLDFDRHLPSVYASRQKQPNIGWQWRKNVEISRELSFTTWEPTMFSYYAMMKPKSSSSRHETDRVIAGSAKVYNTLKTSVAAPMYSRMKLTDDALSLREGAVNAAEEDTIGETDVQQAMQMHVRDNFCETAFFLPALRTDAEGRVTIDFTLPESLTQWNFTALAHDKTLNYGLLNDTIVAQKKLMTEVAAPRFLRAGDVTEIPVTVRNMTEDELNGELIFLITEAATGRPLKTEKRAFTLKAAATDGSQLTCFFPITVDCDVNVRAVARAADFSDGEQHNIPFIDGRERVQVSIPFSSTKQGNIHLDLAPLHLGQLMKQDAACRPTLTLEYCDNPIWNVVRVVPALLEGEACSANDWATRLYTIEVADFLAQSLQDTESAALIDSLVAARDIPALRYAARDHLADYQNGDGGFSWFKGFLSSPWITTDVCVLLARQQKMTGSATAERMLTRAVAYLESVAAEEVKEMKRVKATSISETMMRYLYVRQLLGLAAGKNESYLLDLAAREKKSLTMYGKGLLAQIAMPTHKADALLALESLLEHTVATPEMGRYFDTQRAFGSWASYKIPTQTMAIEALGSMGRDVEQHEMMLWLLQSKRTQQWESSRASADATYALLHGDCNPEADAQLFQTLSPEGYSKRQLSPDEAACAIKTDSYNINKETDGLSWGALYADYTLPAEMVEAGGAGFTLSRTWEVRHDGKWAPIDVTTKVKVGDHVRQNVTLRAERDYDFVQLECSRAACLEPLAPLSGLCWMGGTRAYRMVRDSRNDYFFEHLAKGTHTFSEELIVDRAGTFATGIGRVQCTFAPEFSAYAPTFSLKVTKM